MSQKPSHRAEIRGAVEARPKAIRQPGGPLRANSTPVTSGLPPSSLHTGHFRSQSQFGISASQGQRHESRYNVAKPPIATQSMHPRPVLVKVKEVNREKDSRQPVPRTRFAHNVRAGTSVGYHSANVNQTMPNLRLPDRNPSSHPFGISRTSDPFIPQGPPLSSLEDHWTRNPPTSIVNPAISRTSVPFIPQVPPPSSLEDYWTRNPPTSTMNPALEQHGMPYQAPHPYPLSQSPLRISSRSRSPERGYLLSTGPPLTTSASHVIPAQEGVEALPRPSPITAISFSPDGNHFATGSKDGKILVSNVNSENTHSRSLTYHSAEITCIDFSPDSATLASSSNDSRLYTCDLKSETRRQSPFEVGAPVTSVAYSPSGQNLVCGTWNGIVKVWHIKTYKSPLHVYDGHSDTVTFVVYSPNGRLIASASDDLTIKIWGVLAQHNPVATIKLQEKVAAVRFTADNGYIVSASFSGSVHVWSRSTGQVILHRILEGNRPFRCFAFSADGNFLASGSSDRAVRIHTTKTGGVISGPHHGHESEIEAVAISLDSKLVVSGGHDASIRKWKIEGHETKWNDILSTYIESLRYKNPALGILDELWARLRPLNPLESTAQRSGMRDWSRYIARGALIGDGAAGEVYEGSWVNISGLRALAPPNVVLKIMRPSIRNDLNEDGGLRKVKRELEVWIKLHHSNIVPFVGVAYGLAEGEDNCPILMSLRMANGDLRKYLSQNQAVARESFPLQIARGLAYLHQFEPEIVHGDLKAQNVFVDGDGTLRLGDFGLSRMLSSDSLWVTKTKSSVGSLRWMAPELLQFKAKITKESDVYAFGMTVFEIFSNQVPFEQLSEPYVAIAVIVDNKRPTRPNTIEDWIWDIMINCWCFEPSQRLKIEEIIKRLEKGGPRSNIPS